MMKYSISQRHTCLMLLLTATCMHARHLQQYMLCDVHNEVRVYVCVAAGLSFEQCENGNEPCYLLPYWGNLQQATANLLRETNKYYKASGIQ